LSKKQLVHVSDDVIYILDDARSNTDDVTSYSRARTIVTLSDDYFC